MITCSVCRHDKDDYEFFRYINKFDREFFTAGIPAKSDVCWDCAGPYKCIKCGETQPSIEYRIGGRICYTCQGVNPTRRVVADAYTRRFQALQVTEATSDLNEDFIGGFEE